MKSMIWHQFKSEWKNYSGFTLVWFVTLCLCGYLLFSWNASYVDYASRGFRETKSEVVYGALIGMIFVIMLLLFKRDDLRDARAFWQTRPMREQPLFIGKMLYFILIVVLPLSLLLFANMWAYDCLTIALLAVFELWLWIFTGLGITVLVLQHQAGWLRAAIPLLLSTVMTTIGVLASLTLIYFTKGDTISIQNYYPIWFNSSLLIATVIMNMAWLRHIKSRWNTTKPRFYSSAIFIVIAGCFLSAWVIKIRASAAIDEGVEVVANQTAVRDSSSSPETTTYSVELGLKGLKPTEIATRIINTNITLESSESKCRISPYITSSLLGFFPPPYRQGMLPRDRGEVGLAQAMACSMKIAFRGSATIPKRVHLTGYAVFEVSNVEEILRTPWTTPAHARGDGWEIDWAISRDRNGGKQAARVKEVRYPLLGWGKTITNRYQKITFGTSNEEWGEYEMIYATEDRQSYYPTHSRRNFSVNLTHYFPEERKKREQQWKSGATLHAFRSTPVRLIKAPIDVWIELPH